MVRTYTVTNTIELRDMLMRASLSCNPLLKDALDDSLGSTVTYSKSIAPVYVPSKWSLSGYAKRSHHATPPGTLKASIRGNQFRHFGNGSLFIGGLFAGASFASHVEEGFYHKEAKRRIPGRHFMKTAIYFVFEPTADRNIEKAVHRMLGRGE